MPQVRERRARLDVPGAAPPQLPPLVLRPAHLPGGHLDADDRPELARVPAHRLRAGPRARELRRGDPSRSPHPLRRGDRGPLREAQGDLLVPGRDDGPRVPARRPLLDGDGALLARPPPRVPPRGRAGAGHPRPASLRRGAGGEGGPVERHRPQLRGIPRRARPRPRRGRGAHRRLGRRGRLLHQRGELPRRSVRPVPDGRDPHPPHRRRARIRKGPSRRSAVPPEASASRGPSSS